MLLYFIKIHYVHLLIFRLHFKKLRITASWESRRGYYFNTWANKNLCIQRHISRFHPEQNARNSLGMFTIEKLFMLLSKEVIHLDKRINMFSRSIKSIRNPQVMSETIASSTSKWNKHRSNPSICYQDNTWDMESQGRIKKQLLHMKIYQVPNNIIDKF